MDIIVDDRRKNNLAAGHLQPTYTVIYLISRRTNLHVRNNYVQRKLRLAIEKYSVITFENINIILNPAFYLVFKTDILASFQIIGSKLLYILWILIDHLLLVRSILPLRDLPAFR